MVYQHCWNDLVRSCTEWVRAIIKEVSIKLGSIQFTKTLMLLVPLVTCLFNNIKVWLLYVVKQVRVFPKKQA